VLKLRSSRRLATLATACAMCFGSNVGAQNTVTLHAVVRNRAAAVSEKSARSEKDASDVVAWLKPSGSEPPPRAAAPKGKVQLVQYHKSFQPHVLVVPVGTVVDFPNRDPFFHNVFSLFDGKRFDLGLYEAGATNSVRFDRVGVCFLFCNIHPEMSAVVVAVDTPYFGNSDASGRILIPNVPDGRYELHVWYERSAPDELKNLTRTVTVSAESRSLGEVSVPENPSFSAAHKNKYGQDYAKPPTPGYSHP
jgi:plastocyanin